MKRFIITALLGLTLTLGFGCSGKDSIRTIRARAEKGEVGALYQLGLKYANGDEAPKDPTTAASWFRKAADQGHGEAQIALGRALVKADGVTKDPAQALKWYLKAAEQGYRAGQIAAGLMYLKGEGTPVDLVQGQVWLTVAEAKTHELDGQSLAAVEAQLSAAQKAEAAALAQALSKRLPKR